jgi:hypothetical protein
MSAERLYKKTYNFSKNRTGCLLIARKTGSLQQNRVRFQPNANKEGISPRHACGTEKHPCFSSLDSVDVPVF